MSEKQFTAHDMELLVFTLNLILNGEGGEIRVLWQGGAYESGTYTDSRRISWYFLILSCMTLLLKLPVLCILF